MMLVKLNLSAAILILLASTTASTASPSSCFHVTTISSKTNVVPSSVRTRRLLQLLSTPTALPATAAATEPSFAESRGCDDRNTYEALDSARVIDPRNGRFCLALDGLDPKKPSGFFGRFVGADARRRTLAVVMPQLGDFDSAEYAELLSAVIDDLSVAGIALRVIGIGDVASARRFASFSGLPLGCLRVDPGGELHRSLGLHGGPDWDVPSWIPSNFLDWFADYVGVPEEEDKVGLLRAWLNYMAMCAGIAAPDTLREIFRGYVGDKNAPERLRPNETIRVGEDLIAVTGVTDVKLGPIEYQSLWKNEAGYQRPAELATVRLRSMVEVLSNFREYVPDQRHLHLRGATFLFDNDGTVLYEHRDTGVLAYSATMPRPLTFLKPYIGEKALNPLGLGDKNINNL